MQNTYTVQREILQLHQGQWGKDCVGPLYYYYTRMLEKPSGPYCSSWLLSTNQMSSCSFLLLRSSVLRIFFSPFSFLFYIVLALMYLMNKENEAAYVGQWGGGGMVYPFRRAYDFKNVLLWKEK